MKKLGCAKCGGTKKMKLGGSAVAKAPVNIFGIPQQNLGTSGQSGNMKKGGTTKVHPLVAFQKFNDDRNKKLAKAEVGMSTGYLGKPVSQSPSNKYIIDANHRKVATPSNSPRSGKIAVKSANPRGIPKGIDTVRTNISKTSASPIKSANPTREPRIKFGDPMVGIPASKPKPKGRYEDVVESNSTRTKAAVKSVSRPIKSNGPGTPASRTAAIPKSSVKTPVQHTSGYTPKRGATTPVKKTVGPRPSVDEMREANIKKYSVLKSKIAEDKKPKSRNTAAEFIAGMVASPVATVAKKVYGMMKKNGGVVKSKKEKIVMAKVTTNRAVQTSCKNTKVRTATGACAPERKPMMKSGGTTFGMLSVKAGVDKNPKPTAADRIAGAKMSNKKMAVGGATESCGPGKPKGCGYAKAQRHNKRSKAMSKVGPVIGKIAGTIATVGALGLGAMKGKKMLENKKSGGTTHPGFKAVQSKIAAKQGISKEAAGAILASSTRKASAKAKAENPRLKKVK